MLKPGLFVSVEMIVDRHEDALIVPRDSVMYRDGVPFVAAVRDGRAKIIQVKVGYTEERLIELLSPLKEGDLVVSFGQRGLEDGEQVQVTKILGESPSSQAESPDSQARESLKR
jgi:membrane fusion protein (multidrug efflux system)